MSKSDQIAKIAVKMFVTIATGAAVLLILSVTVGRKTVEGQRSENDTNLEKCALLERVANSPDSPLIADNSEGPPLFILAANVKEVTGAKYQRLTGLNADAPGYTTLPDVKLINNASQDVKEFTLCMLHKYSNRKICIRRTGIEIEPSKDFSVESSTWGASRKVMLRKFTDKEGSFQQDRSKPQLDSEAMWLPGSAADYTLVVGSVEFADGSKWITKR
jgi:hypothetical protein